MHCRNSDEAGFPDGLLSCRPEPGTKHTHAMLDMEVSQSGAAIPLSEADLERRDNPQKGHAYTPADLSALAVSGGATIQYTSHKMTCSILTFSFLEARYQAGASSKMPTISHFIQSHSSSPQNLKSTNLRTSKGSSLLTKPSEKRSCLRQGLFTTTLHNELDIHPPSSLPPQFESNTGTEAFSLAWR